MTKALMKRDTAPALPLPNGFVDFEGKSNIPARTFINARIALAKLGVTCWHDAFTDKSYVGGCPLNSDVGGQLTDEVVSLLRVMIRDEFKFEPGHDNMWHAVKLVCREHSIHPVREYLEACAAKCEPWDDSRIDTMLRDYFGAPDTPFIRAVSRIGMVASCRRIFEPGCKFDYMTVLEGPEGRNKSSALAALYSETWFSDQSILGLDDKQLAEAVRGRWGLESADLSGIRKAEVERVKAQLSRSTDRVRPAYGRAVIDTPRSCVLWGTTNDREYLRSQTGNRRFFPVPVGRADVEALRRDRDLLWGAAMHAHRTGESIMLPEALWAAAAIEQSARTVGDPWEDTLQSVAELASRTADDEAQTVGGHYACDGTRERIATAYILGQVLCIPSAQQSPEHTKRLGVVMRKLGWEGPYLFRIGGRQPVRGYERVREPEPWE